MVESSGPSKRTCSEDFRPWFDEGGSGTRPLAVPAHLQHSADLAHCKLNPMAAYVPPFEEFPPLEKGRTLKIRDTYGASVPNHGDGSAWPRKISSGHAPRDTDEVEVPNHGDDLARSRNISSGHVPRVTYEAELPKHGDGPARPRNYSIDWGDETPWLSMDQSLRRMGPMVSRLAPILMEAPKGAREAPIN